MIFKAHAPQLRSSALILAFLLLWAFPLLVFSQTGQEAGANSPVFKNYKPPTASPRIEHSDITYQMWEGFRVLQQANAGDAVSQFEVSIRYLTGRGFTADTVKAAYWTKRAAERNHLLARFNLGIFQFNGWGIEWNPFEAFRNFLYAAQRNIPEAQYALAQFYIENLVVPANWKEAYRWMKLASDSGYAPAKNVLKEFARRGYGEAEPATQNFSNDNTGSATLQLSFINFSDDTLVATPDSVLVDDLHKASLMNDNPDARSFVDSLSLRSGNIVATQTTFQRMLGAAEWGSPEALTVVARCLEKGYSIREDKLAAASYYIRAIRMDSPRAPRLLFSLLQEPQFFPLLKAQVTEENPDARYVWSCLTALGMDQQLTEAQALHMLERAVTSGHAPAMVELGLCYYTGRWTRSDIRKAEELWRRAEKEGSREAGVRLAVSQVRRRDKNLVSAIGLLERAAREGSTLAGFALGYCYETGSGLVKSKSLAARLYRISAQRGSQDAARALRRLHDHLRPVEKQYQIVD